MFDRASTSLRQPTPASVANDQPGARHRRRPQHEAYALYVRLHWLLYAAPKGHPACQPLATAVVAANAHWRALAPGAGRATRRAGR